MNFITVGLLFSVLAANATPLHRDKTCKILWDGRVPKTATLTSFDKPNPLFNNTEFLGQNQTWSQVLKFPSVPLSLFDKSAPSGAKPVTVTINNASIYFHDPTFPETGFRRTELQPTINTGSDITNVGTTTVHFSLRSDPEHPLNYTHEYQAAWQERIDLGADHFALKTGTPFDPAKEDIKITNPKTLRLVGINNLTPEKNAFITDFTDEIWHNFAVTIGWTTNQTTVYYSRNDDHLKKVAGPFFNDFSDQGLYHFGFLKLPIGPPNISIVNQGFQEEIKGYEGLIYGGLFIEDSSHGCVSLS